MSWEMQIKVRGKDGKEVFTSVRFSGEDKYIYRYPTKMEAEYALDVCYPSSSVMPWNKRVVEVDEPANMNGGKG